MFSTNLHIYFVDCRSVFSTRGAPPAALSPTLQDYTQVADPQVYNQLRMSRYAPASPRLNYQNESIYTNNNNNSNNANANSSNGGESGGVASGLSSREQLASTSQDHLAGGGLGAEDRTAGIVK